MRAPGAPTVREWRPVVDRRSMPVPAFYPRGPTCSTDIPLLIGAAKDECRLHLGSADAHAFDIGWDELAPRLKGALNFDPTATIAFYKQQFPTATASELLFKIFTFYRWRYSAIWQAERKAEQHGAPAYVYRVDWETNVDGGRWRAPHTIEIPLVFDNVAKSESLVDHTLGAQAMADKMSAVWTGFARTGKPHVPGGPAWPAYATDTRATFCFDNADHVEHDLEHSERLYFSAMPPRLPL